MPANRGKEPLLLSLLVWTSCLPVPAVGAGVTVKNAGGTRVEFRVSLSVG